MESIEDRVYVHALIAVFSAAFELGFDPYALAVQAKMDVALRDRKVLRPLAPGVEQIINESLFVAKVLRC
ncbi:hypothetical protein ACCD10_17955 [Pseudomonas sp. Pseusp122]|uniref:hypothetical protein n=1 Tax=unclassified Pseudomonas TaxID=196821 RepID=UPI0039A48609